MALTEIKPMHGEDLYDKDGNLVGKWNGERGMFAECYVVRERTCKCEQDYDCDEPVQGRWWTCSACESTFAYERGFSPRYCPECGAKVVDE